MDATLSCCLNEAFDDIKYKKEISSIYKNAFFEITKEILKKEINPQREMSQHQKDTIDKYLDSLSFPEEAKSKYSDCFDFLNKYSV